MVLLTPVCAGGFVSFKTEFFFFVFVFLPRLRDFETISAVRCLHACLFSYSFSFRAQVPQSFVDDWKVFARRPKTAEMPVLDFRPHICRHSRLRHHPPLPGVSNTLAIVTPG